MQKRHYFPKYYDLAIKKVHITLLHVVCTKDVAVMFFANE